MFVKYIPIDTVNARVKRRERFAWSRREWSTTKQNLPKKEMDHLLLSATTPTLGFPVVVFMFLRLSGPYAQPPKLGRGSQWRLHEPSPVAQN